ncbi:MAG: NAD(P)/FAD-dependent oxidoreductase, partial [Candidatus Angelobacter sp.]
MEKAAAAEYDLIVVGGGPAGCACAITAARSGARVLLLEKETFPRHKVCGEFVSPESVRLLAALLGRDSLLSVPEIPQARIFSEGKSVALRISPPACSIPRFQLDALLLEAARKAGVLVLEKKSVREVRRHSTFLVMTDAEVFRARAVVNASGRWSRLNHVEQVGDKWIGIKAHFREAAPHLSVDLYFFPGGYCGVQPISIDGVNACAMVKAGMAHSLSRIFALHPQLWRRSRDWEQLFPAITTSGLMFRQPQTEHQGLMLAGDAAGFIDPFAGDGISLALHSGTLAAQSLAPFFAGKATMDQAHREYRLGYARRFRPAFRSAARLRRL